MKPLLAALVLVAAPPALAKPPNCQHWPETMALAALKNDGAFDPTKLDATATQATLLAAQPIGHSAWREIYDITFHERQGRTVEVVTSNDASDEECSLSAVTVRVVAKRLGGS